MVAVSLGWGVVQLDVSAVNLGVKAIGDSLGGSTSQMAWVVSAYVLPLAALILTAGSIADRVGGRRVCLVGFSLFTAASIACAIAPSLTVLLAARSFQGVAAAALVPSAMALLNHSYLDTAARARAVGVVASGTSLAFATGPVVGGLLIGVAGWRSIFFINVPIGLVGLFLAARNADETTRSPGRALDLKGQITAVVALATLAGGMIEGGELGWTNRGVLGTLAISAALFVAFLVVEQTSDSPMLPLGLFRVRGFAVSTTVGFMINLSFYGLLFVLSLRLQEEDHHSPLQSGLALLPAMLACLGANLTSTWAAPRLSARTSIVVGQGVMGAGCLGLIPVDGSSSYASLVVPLIALGFGLGFVVPPLTSELLGSVELEHSGIASGALFAMRQSGSVVGVALYGSLLYLGFDEGFRAAVVISTLMTAAGIGITSWAGEVEPRRPTRPVNAPRS